MKRNMKRLPLLLLFLSVSLPANSQSPDKLKREYARTANQQKVKVEYDDKSSRDGQYWFSRGYELHQSDRYQQAIEAFAHSIDLGYRQATAMYNIACGFALLNDKENALTWLERSFALGFDRTDLLREDSDLDPVRSDPRFQQLITRVSAKDEQKRSKSSESKKQDRFQAAVSLYEQLRRESSDDGNKWYRTGSLLLQLRDFDRAIPALSEAVRHLGHSNSSAMYNMACAYALKGDREAAYEWLEKSINAGFDNTDHIQSDPDIASLRADSRFKRIEKLSSALSLSQFSSGNFNGSLYSKQRWMPAVKHFESFLRTAPDNGRGWFNLGYSLHYSSEHERAIRSFEQAIRHGYRKPVAMYNIACAYAMMGNKDSAFEWLEKSTEAGFEVGSYAKSDTDLDNLRSDARFKRFLDMSEQEDKHKEKHEK